MGYMLRYGIIEGLRDCDLNIKLYLVDFAKEEAGLDACLIAKTSMGWLWHRRLAPVSYTHLF